MDEDLKEKIAVWEALNGEKESVHSESSYKSVGGDDNEIKVTSLRDANILLQKHLTQYDGIYRKKLVDYITDPDNRVLSESDLYHNFIIDLFQAQDYDISLKVCDFALQRAPYHRDILGDAINACGSSSQFEKGIGYLERAFEIDRNAWSSRLFLYSIDFLKKLQSAYMGNIKAFYDRLHKENLKYPFSKAPYELAMDLVDLFITVFPYDEHGYNQKAELLILMNNRAEAERVLKEFLFDTRPDKKNAKSRLVSAQCCATYLNLLDASNQYDEIIRVCNQGLQNTTQEQPSAQMGYFMYKKAEAYDAKAHNDGFTNPEYIIDALQFYQAAYDLNQDRNYSRTIEQRYAVLRAYATREHSRVNFRPLIKRGLFVREEDMKSDTKQ